MPCWRVEVVRPDGFVFAPVIGAPDETTAAARALALNAAIVRKAGGSPLTELTRKVALRVRILASTDAVVRAVTWRHDNSAHQLAAEE